MAHGAIAWSAEAIRALRAVAAVAVSSCVIAACSDDGSTPPRSAGTGQSGSGGGAAGAGGSVAAGGFGGGVVAGAAGAPTKVVVACGNAVQSGDGCATAGECCRTVVPDGPTTYLRCGATGWAVDASCIPPVVCEMPLTGKLVRGDGKELAVTCVQPAVKKPPGLVRSVGGSSMELFCASLPTAGAVFQVAPESAFVADPPADRASFRVGLCGGIAGFNVDAAGASGTITVTEATTDASGQLQSVHATFDAQTTGPQGASDPPGEWDGPLTGSF